MKKYLLFNSTLKFGSTSFPNFTLNLLWLFAALPPSTAPPVPGLFSFDLVQVTEQQVELRWGDLSPLNLRHHSSFEIFLHYHKKANGELGQSEEGNSKTSEDKRGTQNQGSVEKIVKVPISLSSRGVTVAGLSPGSVYTFTLQASNPAGSSWNLGQTQTAYTSESAENLLHT